MASQTPFSTVQRNANGREWESLARVTFMFWALLMMPLYITLETALVAGLDHADNQWKSLLARPVPRWTWYVAKLMVVVAMVAASTAILFGGILMNGAILPRVQTQLAFASPIPWSAIFQQGARVAGLSFLSLTIQHWVSLRWRSFSIAIGVGIVGMVVGYVAALATSRDAGWPQYFPWSLPMLIFARHSANIEAVLWISGASGLLVATAGCLDFCRREVT
jgi:hypothetical protein